MLINDALRMTSRGDTPSYLLRTGLTRRHLLFLAGSAFGAVVAAACRDDSPHALPQEDPVEPNGIVVDVQSIDNTFRPDRIEITPGTEVRWTNMGRSEHDVLPVEGAAWGVAKEEFKPGDSYSTVFTELGEVRYYCSIHGTTELGMVGTIVVVDETAATTSASA